MAGERQIKMDVKGMHCSSCVRRLTGALEKLPGLRIEAVEIGSATVLYDPAQLHPEQIKSAVERIGFQASLV